MHLDEVSSREVNPSKIVLLQTIVVVNPCNSKLIFDKTFFVPLKYRYTNSKKQIRANFAFET